MYNKLNDNRSEAKPSSHIVQQRRTGAHMVGTRLTAHTRWHLLTSSPLALAQLVEQHTEHHALHQYEDLQRENANEVR